MPITIAPDPNSPSGWSWVDAATGQPAIQPGGPGTPIIAPSDRPKPDVGGPTQGPAQPKQLPGSVGYTDIASALGKQGWTPVPGSLTREPDKLVQNPDPRAGADPSVPLYVPQATGRWQVVFKTGTGANAVNRVVYLTPAGTPPGAGQDPTSPGFSWNIVSAPSDLSAADVRTVSPLSDWTPLGPDGKPIAAGDTTTKPKFLVDPKDPTNRIELPDPTKGELGTLKTVNGTTYIIKPDGSSTIAVGPDGKPIVETKDAQQFNVQGVGLVNYDPNTGKVTTLAAAKPTPTSASDIQWTDIPDSTRQQGNVVVDGKLQPIEGMTRDKSDAKPSTVFND